MTICDLTQSYNPTSGGIRTYIQEKQNYIEHHTHHRHVLIVPGERDEKETRGCLTRYSIKAKMVSGCEPYRFTFRLDKVLDILYREQPDIIELGSAYILPYAVFLYRRHYACSVIGFYHTDFPDAYVGPFLQNYPLILNTGKNLAKSYAKFIYNQCDIAIATSDFMRQKLLDMEIRRVEMIHLGVDLDLFHPLKRNAGLRRSLGIDDNSILLVYSGRLDSEKRTHILLEAFDRISDRFPGQLVCVGEGPYKSKVLALSEQNEKIKFIPYRQDRDELAKILASSDIYITAGPHETFGLSIIEAQACGLPVIGVNGGALFERVPAHVGVLGETDSISQMSENILELSFNGFRQKGKNARKMIEKQFSWHQTFTKLFLLYENLDRKNIC